VPKRTNPLTRGSVVMAALALAFTGLAGVGLAQITTNSSPDPFAAPLAADGHKPKPGKKNKKNKRAQQTTTTTTSSSSTTTTGDSEGEGNGQAKVDVCHKPDKKSGHMINIAEPAAAAHLAHGDTLGSCPVLAPPTSTTTKQAKTPKQQKAPKQQKPASQTPPALPHKSTPKKAAKPSKPKASKPKASKQAGGKSKGKGK
jgi:hypothetical protein